MNQTSNQQQPEKSAKNQTPAESTKGKQDTDDDSMGVDSAMSSRDQPASEGGTPG